MTSSPTHAPRSANRPPNRPFRTVPIPINFLLSTAAKGPDNAKSSKFGSCPIMSRTCTRVTAEVSMFKEVTDPGSFQSEGSRDSGDPPFPSQIDPGPKNDILSTSVNHGMRPRNLSGKAVFCPTLKRKSLTWWAGLSSRTGNVSSHSHALVGVKVAVWKRWPRDG